MKKLKVLAVCLIFIISFLCHYAFDIFPCILSSILFPVNESIWEHMKILFTSTIIYGIIDYILLKKRNIQFHNFSFQLFCSAFLSIPIFLIIYLPIYNFIGENLPITLTLMLLTYMICQYISYKILQKEELKIVNKLSIWLIIFMYLIFAYLTYFPINNYLFYDIISQTYGINK